MRNVRVVMGVDSFLGYDLNEIGECLEIGRSDQCWGEISDW